MQGRQLLTLLFFFSFLTVFGKNDLRIGILQNKSVKTAIVITDMGGYDVLCDGRKVTALYDGDALRIEVVPGGLSLKTLNAEYSCSKQLVLVAKHQLSTFRMRSLDHKMAEKYFTDGLEISRERGLLKLVNIVDIENYVAGVVESEAGIKQNLEYYKLQSIICRTYALSNLRRHEAEGFHLCDQVHCQVYNSKNRNNDNIFRAVWATRGMVVVDPQIELITATFHSNCGGETVNSEDVWSKPLPYLRTVRDTFCTTEPHAIWRKEVPKEQWLSYLERNYDYPVEDHDHLSCALNNVPSSSEVYFANTKQRIPLKQIRRDFALRSTYFSVKHEGDKVVLEGKGFGHGVGVCQEGAMNMSRQGLSYSDILHYYYTDVHLVDLSVIDFFKD